MTDETMERKRPFLSSSSSSSSSSLQQLISTPARNRDDSPSTHVADDLSRLDMAQTHQTTSRKRPAEIDETPDAYDSIRPSSHASPTPNSTSKNRARFILHPPRRVTSPPPSTPVASPNPEHAQPISLPVAIMIAQDKLSTLRCDSPTAFTHPAIREDENMAQQDDENTRAQHVEEEAPLDSESMTWQDSEITGHDIDHAADDDGEGINGIGFIPAPAIVTKRSEWRRRQISEWRARESKEARQRRYDKRKPSHRDSAISFDDSVSSKRRMVRFA